MADHPLTDTQIPELPEEERARIRAEVRYTVLALQETRSPEKPKTTVDKILGYLSNGFVLLLIGSLITSVLVPKFQRDFENKRQRAALMQESLSQFLLYSNSIWQEYYAIFPLTQQPEINKDEYIRYMNEISQIKLKRYDAYAKVRALALVFRSRTDKEASTVESALQGYAVSVNSVSEAIDTWLRNLYCTPTNRPRSPCATFDPNFDAYEEFRKIQKLVLTVGNENAQAVAAKMIEGLGKVH